jgi:putative MATE family efflux protein
MIPAGALMIMGNVFNGILMGEGLMKKIMISMIIATMVNIGLDPVFIFLLGMGVGGAGMATVASQLIAAVYILSQFIRKKTTVPVEWRFKNANIGVIKEIVAVGFPQTAGQMTMSVSFLFLNRLIMGIDPRALTAFSICGRFDYILIMPILSIATAMITMMGQNFGRKNYSRVFKIWKIGIITALLLIGFLASVLILAAPRIYPFFSNVEQVVRYAVLQTRIIEYSFMLAAVAMLSRASFQAIGRAIPGMIITVIRIAGLAVPMAYFYVRVADLGIYGVWFGIISGNFIAAIISFLWVKRTIGAYATGGGVGAPLNVGLEEELVAD